MLKLEKILFLLIIKKRNFYNNRKRNNKSFNYRKNNFIKNNENKK